MAVANSPYPAPGIIERQARADAAGVIGWKVSADSVISALISTPLAPAVAVSAEGIAWWCAAEPADHGFGRSRSGWTTKTHLVCEQGCKLMAGDDRRTARRQPQFLPVLARIRIS